MLESREHNVHETWSWDATTSPEPQRLFSDHSSDPFETFLSKLKTSEKGYITHYVVVTFPGAQILYFKSLICSDSGLYFFCAAFPFQYMFQSSHNDVVSHVGHPYLAISGSWAPEIQGIDIITSCGSMRVPKRRSKSAGKGCSPDLHASEVLSGWNSGNSSCNPVTHSNSLGKWS